MIGTVTYRQNLTGFMKKLLDFFLNWPKSYISGVDLNNILDKSADSRHAIIKRAIQKEYLIQIKKDFFLINKKFTKKGLNYFEIAPLIYGPSYISFESALSYHGWIPEAVRTITSASVKRSKEFDTPIAVFSYEHIPIKAFSYGIEQVRQENITLFIASPLKALADIAFSRKRSWQTLDDISEDMRIELENFKNCDKQLLLELIENYPSQKVRKVLNILKTGLN